MLHKFNVAGLLLGIALNAARCIVMIDQDDVSSGWFSLAIAAFCAVALAVQL